MTGRRVVIVHGSGLKPHPGIRGSDWPPEGDGLRPAAEALASRLSVGGCDVRWFLLGDATTGAEIDGAEFDTADWVLTLRGSGIGWLWLLAAVDEERVLVVLLPGGSDEVIPGHLQGRIALDLSSANDLESHTARSDFERQIQDLLRRLHRDPPRELEIYEERSAEEPASALDEARQRLRQAAGRIEERYRQVSGDVRRHAEKERQEKRARAEVVRERSAESPKQLRKGYGRAREQAQTFSLTVSDALKRVADAVRRLGGRRSREVSIPGESLATTPEREPPRVDQVQVSTVAPRAVEPGARFLVEVVFHVEGFEIEADEDRRVDENEANLALEEGAVLTVRLVSPDEGVFSIDDPEVRLVWGPPSRRLEFRLRAAEDLAHGVYDLRVEYWLEGVRLARSYLEVHFVESGSPALAEEPSVRPAQLPGSAFASYSRKDRGRVAERVDSLKAVGIDVFLDCLDIQQGANWQDVLERELLSREALLLFWSTAAKGSEWVEKEWRFALERRGLASILPNALEPPDICKPPPELASLQFGSVLTELARQWAAEERGR